MARITNVEDALREFNITYTKEFEYYKVLCPYHSDTKPSGTIHHKTEIFKCWVCNKKTTIIGFLSKACNLTLVQTKIKLGTGSDCKKPFSSLEIEQFHTEIWKHKHFLAALYTRGISDELIRYYRLGVHDYNGELRIVIPVLNDIGEYAMYQSYVPGAQSRKFLQFQKDKGKNRLFPLEQLEYDQVLVCGGLLKALAAAAILNKYDIGAISPSTSESTPWPNDLSPRFQNKLLYICNDVDDIGIKATDQRCRALNSYSRELHHVFLPLDKDKYPKGDINDYLAQPESDLYKLILDSPEWKFTPGGETADTPPIEMGIREAFRAENVTKKVKFPCIISGIADAEYLVPSVVEVKCPREDDFCVSCDVNMQAFSQNTLMKISPDSRAILHMAQEKEYFFPQIFREYFHIPKICNKCEFIRREEHNVVELRIEEQLPATSREEPFTNRVGYVVNGPITFENNAYVMTGRLYPSPKNQVSAFLVSQCEPTQDSIESYIPKDIPEFEHFVPREWTVNALQEKLDEIYSDLEANVTHIYRRREQHIAYDLAWHSLLHIDFKEIKNQLACVQVLTVGDTAQGKSDMVQRLRNHYGLGHIIDCANTSRVGLTIGLEKSANKHFPVYGAFVKNDKKLVILEELSELPEKDLQTLREVRSSGIIQVSKIRSPRKHARVRIIANSNPVGERRVASYVFGIDAAMALIGTNADLRRFDLVTILGEDDVPKPIPEQANPPKFTHKFTADMCQKIVLKAWKCEQVEFKTPDLVHDVCKDLIKDFGDGPPVLEGNSTRMKLVKLCVALAARVNSYEGRQLIVHDCFIEYMAQYLRRNYISKSCKLDEKARLTREASKLRDSEGLVKFLRDIINIDSVVLKLNEVDLLSAQYIRELVGDFMQGSILFSRLVQSNAITKIKGDVYVKNAEFVMLLHEWKTSKNGKPTYLEKY